MKAIQLARDHCANMNQDGSCLGAVIDDDLQIKACRPKPECVLVVPGVRCEYFEQCVIPMNSSDWAGLQTPQQHIEFGKAVDEYRRAANVPSLKKRLCECGTELEPRKRYCYKCAKKHRRKSWGEANQKKQDQSTTVKPENHAKTPAKQG